jgi:HAD superfamily hydrolase (TIGR01450 family)
MSDFDRRFTQTKVVFLDLDGTVYMGDNLIPGALDFLDYLKNKGIFYYFLSNNSSRSKAAYVQRLGKMGVNTSQEQIILSTDGVLAYLQEQQVNQVYVLGTKSMLDMFWDLGFETDAPQPEYIVLGFDTELTYEKLRKAALHMQDGVPLLATHPDLVCPTPLGPIPDVGAMLALFETATGIKPLKIFGKPNPEMVQHILTRHEALAQEAVMIGDRIYTDMELAFRVGCNSILVLSGEARRADLEGLAQQPSLVAESIGHILIS